MRSLLILNISVNNLRGRVWDTGIFRNLSAESFLGNPGLCGRLVGRPCPGDMVSPLVRSHHKKGPSLVTIIGAAVERVVLIFFALLLVRYIIYRRGSVQADTVVLFSEYLKSLELTAEEIQAATAFTDASGSVSGTFSRSLSGNIRRAIGFSNIEKAVLPDGTVFAVKQWIIAKVRKKERLMLDSEMLNLSKIRHRNLSGSWDTPRIQAPWACSWNSCLMGVLTCTCILQASTTANLSKLLYSASASMLQWNERLRIIMGITAGLVCLHHETCGNALAHCGLKAANVLLDSDMESKLVDFGMARLIKRSIKGSSAASWIVSSGYAPPEHGVSSELTTAGDVYSYGVLILEIITGKRPTIEEVRVGVTLPAWVQDLRDQSAIDVSLFQSADESQLNQILHIMKVAILCTSHLPGSRPSMLQVLLNLQEMPQSAIENQELVPLEVPTSKVDFWLIETLRRLSDGNSGCNFVKVVIAYTDAFLVKLDRSRLLCRSLDSVLLEVLFLFDTYERNRSCKVLLRTKNGVTPGTATTGRQTISATESLFLSILTSLSSTLSPNLRPTIPALCVD
nr:protein BRASSINOSTEROID INSENSITIVE 1-like [Physcomitrium patens]|eukprot:XP_024364885.1 protein BRASSINOSTEROID INSENSITIVE 1-like [Physcomitrella patens]